MCTRVLQVFSYQPPSKDQEPVLELAKCWDAQPPFVVSFSACSVRCWPRALRMVQRAACDGARASAIPAFLDPSVGVISVSQASEVPAGAEPFWARTLHQRASCSSRPAPVLGLCVKMTTPILWHVAAAPAAACLGPLRTARQEPSQRHIQTILLLTGCWQPAASRADQTSASKFPALAVCL